MSAATSTSTITLCEPVAIDGKDVTEITLREPRAGELRGTMHVQLINLEYDTTVKVLTRITTPALNAAQIGGMPYADYNALALGLLAFTQKSPTMRAMAAAPDGEAPAS